SARLEKVEAQARDSLNAARALNAENKLAAARVKLAEARAKLGQDHTALGSLGAQVDAYEAELNRFEQFLNLIDRAYEAETTSAIQLSQGTDGAQALVGTSANPIGSEGYPARAVPFLLEALALYKVLERDDWSAHLEAGLLERDQVAQIRVTAYEVL